MDEEFGNIGSGQTSFGTEYNFSVVNLDNNQKSSSQQRKLSQKDIQSLNTSTETASETVPSGSSETANASSAGESVSASSSSASGSASSSSASSSSASSGASGAASSAGASAGSAATVAGSTAAGVGLVTVVVGISTTLGLACSIPSDSIKTAYDKSTMFAYSFVAEFREEGELFARVKGTNYSDEKNYKLIFDEAEPLEGEEKIYTTNIEGVFEGEFLSGIQYAFDIYSVTAGIENNYYHELFMGELDRNNPTPTPTPTPIVNTYYVLIDGESHELTKVSVEGSSALEAYTISKPLESGASISFKENETTLVVDLELDPYGDIKAGNNVGKGEIENTFSVLTAASDAEITLSKYENYWTVWVSGYVEPQPVTKTYYALVDGEAIEMTKAVEEGSSATEMYIASAPVSSGSTITFTEGNETLSVSLEMDPETAKPLANNNVSTAEVENLFEVLCPAESATIKLSHYDSFGWTVWVTGYDTTTYSVCIDTKQEVNEMTLTRVTPESGAIESFKVEGVLLEEDYGIYFYKEGERLTGEIDVLRDSETGRPVPNNNVSSDGDTFYVQKSVSMGTITLSRFSDYWGVWVSGNESEYSYYVEIEGVKYGMEAVTLDPSDALEDYMLDGVTVSEGQMIKFYDASGDEMEVVNYKNSDTGEDTTGNNVSMTADGGMIINNYTNTRITLSKFSSYWGAWVAGYTPLAESYSFSCNSQEPQTLVKVSPTPSEYVAQYTGSIVPDQTISAGVNIDFYMYNSDTQENDSLYDIYSAGSLNNLQKYEQQGVLFKTRSAISEETTVTLNVDMMGNVSVFIGGYVSPTDIKGLINESSNNAYNFTAVNESQIDTGVNNMFTATIDGEINAGDTFSLYSNSTDCSELTAVMDDHTYYTGYDEGVNNNLIGRLSDSSREDSTYSILFRSANYDMSGTQTGATTDPITVTLYEYFDHYDVTATGFVMPFTIEEVTMEIQSIQTPTANVNALVYDFSAPDFDENAGDALSIMVIGDPSSGQNGQSVASGTWTPGGTNNYATLENFTEASENIYITITLTHDSQRYVVAFFTLQY